MKTLDVRKANKTQWVLQGIGAFFVFMLPHLVSGVALEIGTYSPTYAADLTGVSRIVDGDTFVIGSEKVRLQGIDAPETDQVCLNANGVRWTCGIDASRRKVGAMKLPRG